MTRKEMMLRMIERLPDDVTYDRVIYHLDVMRGIEIGSAQADRGEGIEHEELFRQLLGEECPAPASSGRRKAKTTSTASVGTSPAKRRARPRRSSVGSAKPSGA